MIASDDRRTHRRSLATALAFSAAFAALHVPFLPRSLEDLDSINFALGLRQFDVARHQPHPPGYPLFILLGRAFHIVFASEAAALAALSILAGSLAALALVTLHHRIFRTTGAWPLAAAALAVTSPLYWLMASRPLSDMTGLAASIGVQVVTLAAPTPNALLAAAFAAGLATGLRSQVFWMTVPLLIWRVSREEVREGRSSRRWIPGIPAAVAFAAGGFVWFVPLIAISGGPGAYWRALSAQGTEDLGGIRMLWTTPTVRELVDALDFAFVVPWAVWPAAAAVLVAAAAGVIVLYREQRRALGILAVAFGPYLLFDILFQETFTSRYGLPLVVPIAFLAARGLQRLPAQIAFVALGLLVVWNAHVGGRSVASLAREPAPVFRLLADMKEAEAGRSAPVLAPDRRQSFDLRRPLLWAKADAPSFDRQLSAPPQHEWLEAVKYWNDGGRAPVWFVVDPRRASIDLVQHGRPARYEWSMPYPVLMSGTRPADASWYRVDGPDWYVGEGWALTPEAAGVADRDRRGPRDGPIAAWVRGSILRNGSLLIGGRNFEPGQRSSLTISAGSIWSKTIDLAPGAFLDTTRLEVKPSDGAMPLPDYMKLEVSARPPARVAIEQFDAAAPDMRAIVGYGDGWYERELDATTGRQWRWLSSRGELRYIAPAGWSLHVEGESPLRYYSQPSRLVVRSGERILRDVTLSSDFSVDVEIPPALEASGIVIETDQTHVPAETSWRRSRDRRRLGLRIFSCELRPASEPGRAASFLPAR